MSRYSPLTQLELDAIGLLEGFSVPKWNGPALPRPDGHAGLEEIIDTVDKLIARGQYLIQAKDGLSIEYTLRGITATAERFMLGTEMQVEQAALLRVLLTNVESFLNRFFSETAHVDRIASAFTELRAKLERVLAGPAKPAGAASLTGGRRCGRRLFRFHTGKSGPVFYGVDNVSGSFPAWLSSR